jgi:hypothetical protein
MSRVRRFFSITGRVLLVLVFLVLAHALLAFFPQPLFAHRFDHKNYTLYMREEIPPEAEEVLERVDQLLAASEVNDTGRRYRAFIFNNDRLMRFLLWRNVHFGCNLANGNSMITRAEVATDTAYCQLFGPWDTRLRTLSETIAHEISHAQINGFLGWRAARRQPRWIIEGYCEYVAQGSAIDHGLGLDLLKYGGFTPGLANFRARLMVEYLLNHEGMTFGELVTDPPDQRQVEARMLAMLREDEPAFLAAIGSRIAPERLSAE